MRKKHAWVGFFSAILLFLLAITGLFLNHKDLFVNSGLKNKRAYPISIMHLPNQSNNYYMATKNGLFYVDKGVFSRQRIPYPAKYISDIELGPQNKVYIAFKNGFILRQRTSKVWERLIMPDNIYNLYDISIKSNVLLMAADTGLYNLNLTTMVWKHVMVSKPQSIVYRWMQQLHTGQFFNGYFKWFNDVAAICLIFLMGTGLKLFFYKR